MTVNRHTTVLAALSTDVDQQGSTEVEQWSKQDHDLYTNTRSSRSWLTPRSMIPIILYVESSLHLLGPVSRSSPAG